MHLRPLRRRRPDPRVGLIRVTAVRCLGQAAEQHDRLRKAPRVRHGERTGVAFILEHTACQSGSRPAARQQEKREPDERDASAASAEVRLGAAVTSRERLDREMRRACSSMARTTTATFRASGGRSPRLGLSLSEDRSFMRSCVRVRSVHRREPRRLRDVAVRALEELHEVARLEVREDRVPRVAVGPSERCLDAVLAADALRTACRRRALARGERGLTTKVASRLQRRLPGSGAPRASSRKPAGSAFSGGSVHPASRRKCSTSGRTSPGALLSAVGSSTSTTAMR